VHPLDPSSLARTVSCNEHPPLLLWKDHVMDSTTTEVTETEAISAHVAPLPADVLENLLGRLSAV
jgi:hypothetical protein